MIKKIFLFAAIIVSNNCISFCQKIPSEIEGTWLGTLNVGIVLRVAFHFEIYEDTLYTLIDSPDQGVSGIETASTTYINDEIVVQIPAIKSSYKGKYDRENKSITGVWIQGGEIPLNLMKVDTVEPVTKKQDPVKPYPYKEEEIVFENKNADSVYLAGTLTIPNGNGPFNAVILVSGSGAQNRNEFLLGHSPFLVLSDYLTRKGIIVLRYDDRGYEKSKGDFLSATTKDFASDASAAVNYLVSRKDLNINNIGIAGHSEGGLIAPITASQNKNVDYIVLMAGTGIPGDSLLNLQGNLIAKASGFNDSLLYYYGKLRAENIKIVLSENGIDSIRKKLIRSNLAFLKTTPPEIIAEMNFTEKDSLAGVDFYATEWMKYFLSYDPRPLLEKTKIPVLAINGTTDLQVPYKENLGSIEASLIKAKNQNYSIVALPGLNHLFQTSTSGSPLEYASNPETFNEKAMETIALWILNIK